MRLENEHTATFWEVTLDGSVVTTRSARIGASAYAQERRFDSHQLALRTYERLIAAKRGEGFRAVEEATSAATLVNAEHEAAIIASPDDANGYLVYADWLLQRGLAWRVDRGPARARSHARPCAVPHHQAKGRSVAEGTRIDVARYSSASARRARVAKRFRCKRRSHRLRFGSRHTARRADGFARRRLLRSLTLNGDKDGVFDALPACLPCCCAA